MIKPSLAIKQRLRRDMRERKRYSNAAWTLVTQKQPKYSLLQKIKGNFIWMMRYCRNW